MTLIYPQERNTICAIVFVMFFFCLINGYVAGQVHGIKEIMTTMCVFFPIKS